MEKEYSDKRLSQMEAFARLLDIMEELRVKCPWDKKQTMESLRTQTIEETYELSDAIMKSDYQSISKELGDVLLHIVFYSKIGEEKKEFDIINVIDLLCDKLIYRHPHVFKPQSEEAKSMSKVDTADQVIKNWEQLKVKEKDGNKRVLSGVPDSLPVMIKAYRMQDKARAVGFDWEERSQVWDKVAEEMKELQDEICNLDDLPEDADSQTKASVRKPAKEELGDVLFSIINAARLYKLNPDTALELTCQKFKRRFTYLEEQTIRKGRSLKDMTLEEMDKYWEEAKTLEKK
ncbi:MAG: nucleoside triphosphate pyrophosphohydrolase [Bacteroidales bacterium]